MDPLYQQLGVAGVLVGTVVYALRWMAARNAALESKMDKASDACVAREALLVARVQSLEESRSKDLTSIAHTVTDALKEATTALRINARAFEKATEESGQHRTKEG